MTGLALLLGHLVGDYVVQNDWMAANKTNPHPGKSTDLRYYNWAEPLPGGGTAKGGYDVGAWSQAVDAWWRGHAACTVHCLLYTLAVLLCTWPTGLYPWWFYLAVGLVHWPVDRFRLARVWMTRVAGQKAFAAGPLAPWSVVVVDNVFHLLTLYALALPSALP